MDDLLRSRIHRLIRDSKDVLHRANEYVAPDGTKVPAAGHLKKEWHGLVGMNASDFITKDPARLDTFNKEVWSVLWDLTKACLYVQHGGLARETKIAPSDFIKLFLSGVSEDDALELAQSFFNDVPPKMNVDSAFYCAAYSEVFQRVASTKSGDPSLSASLSALSRGFAKRATELLKNLPPLRQTDLRKTPARWYEAFSERIIFYDRERGLALEAVRAASIWKHLNRLQITTSDKNTHPVCEDLIDEDEVDEALLGLLERAAAPDTPKGPPLLLTLAARALAGRYANGPLTPSHRWRRALSLTVKHVIERQGAQADADWGLPRTFLEKRNPTATRYLPLLHILGLPEPVLIDTIEQVVAACESAITEVSVWLDDVDRMLRSPNWWKNHSKASRFYRKVVAGMAVGAAVYERARDILSEAVLDDLGATVPRFKGEDSIESRAPECLGFQQSLLEGVIKPWTKWGDERPGAILLFGPPGTGKTSNAKLIAARLDKETENDMGQWRFLIVSPADFVRKGRDKIVGSAEKLFERLKDVRRCVVLLDEMEEFLRARGGPSADRDARLITTAFLPLLQEVSDRREIVLIVATNFIGAIDPAVMRPGRFDMILPLGPMGEKGRVKAILNIFNDKYAAEEVFEAALMTLREKYEPEEELVEAILETLKGIAITDEEEEKETTPKILEILAQLVRYTHGCTYTEIAFLMGEVKDAVEKALPAKKTDHDDAARDESAAASYLVRELWNERVKKPPLALLSQAGSSWDSFREEVNRFSRLAPKVKYEPDESYWQRPAFPDYDVRHND